MNKSNIIILFIVIIIIIKIIDSSKEHFVYVKRIYDQGGSCNDYIPDYTDCKKFPFDNDTNENFDCSNNYSKYYPNQIRPNVTYYWEGFDKSQSGPTIKNILTTNIKFKYNDKYLGLDNSKNYEQNKIVMNDFGSKFSLKKNFILDQSGNIIKIIYPSDKIDLSQNINSELKNGVGFIAPLMFNNGYLFAIFKNTTWFLMFDQNYNLKWTKDISNASIFNIVI